MKNRWIYRGVLLLALAGLSSCSKEVELPGGEEGRQTDKKYELKFSFTRAGAETPVWGAKDPYGSNFKEIYANCAYEYELKDIVMFDLFDFSDRPDKRNKKFLLLPPSGNAADAGAVEADPSAKETYWEYRYEGKTEDPYIDMTKEYDPVFVANTRDASYKGGKLGEGWAFEVHSPESSEFATAAARANYRINHPYNFLVWTRGTLAVPTVGNGYYPLLANAQSMTNTTYNEGYRLKNPEDEHLHRNNLKEFVMHVFGGGYNLPCPVLYAGRAEKPFRFVPQKTDKRCFQNEVRIPMRKCFAKITVNMRARAADRLERMELVNVPTFFFLMDDGKKDYLKRAEWGTVEKVESKEYDLNKKDATLQWPATGEFKWERVEKMPLLTTFYFFDFLGGQNALPDMNVDDGKSLYSMIDKGGKSMEDINGLYGTEIKDTGYSELATFYVPEHIYTHTDADKDWNMYFRFKFKLSNGGEPGGKVYVVEGANENVPKSVLRGHHYVVNINTVGEEVTFEVVDATDSFTKKETEYPFD